MAAAITVKLHNGESHEGSLFCVDPVTHALVIDKGEGVFTLINPAQIAKIEPEELPTPTPNIASMGISLGNIEKKEELALIAAERNIDSVNKNVTPIVQSLYDKLAHMFTSCRWEGVTIVILDNIAIENPYDKAVLISGDTSQLAYVQKVLTGERRKLAME